MTANKPKAHLGKNVKRIRIIRGISQESLAEQLGEEWNQKRISHLEMKEEIEDGLLESIASIFKVSPEYIKEFDEDRAIYNVQNNYDTTNSSLMPNGPNGINNVTSSFDAENVVKKYQELYERLFKEKDEVITTLQKTIAMLEARK